MSVVELEKVKKKLQQEMEEMAQSLEVRQHSQLEWLGCKDHDLHDNYAVCDRKKMSLLDYELEVTM